MAFAVIGHSFVRRLQDHPLLKLEGADVLQNYDIHTRKTAKVRQK
jgi:hypothetical protein